MFSFFPCFSPYLSTFVTRRPVISSYTNCGKKNELDPCQLRCGVSSNFYLQIQYWIFQKTRSSPRSSRLFRSLWQGRIVLLSFSPFQPLTDYVSIYRDEMDYGLTRELWHNNLSEGQGLCVSEVCVKSTAPQLCTVPDLEDVLRRPHHAC